MIDAWIYDHVRTPRGRGKPDGALHEVTPVNLASQVLRALVNRNGIDSTQVEDVLLGCVSAVAEQGGNIARIAALNADFADTVPGISLNRYCGSGLEAINLAAAKVHAGMADLVIAGGVESMSRVAMGSDGGAWAVDPQLAFKTRFIMQGVSADLLASKHGFDRKQCDEYALASQQRATRARDAGWFNRALVPVTDLLGLPLLDHDECIRENTTLAQLGELAPAFARMGHEGGFDAIALQRYPQLERIEHVHHAGNSSAVVDGACGVLIGNAEAGKRLGLPPRARLRSTATLGSEPTIMLGGIAPAARKALDKAGMQPSDIDLWEINEAFAAVVLTCMQALSIPHAKVNVNGGAIAMGHPLGASGAMILGTLLDEMERRDVSTGLVGLCEAAGMATASIIERT